MNKFALTCGMVCEILVGAFMFALFFTHLNHFNGLGLSLSGGALTWPNNAQVLYCLFLVLTLAASIYLLFNTKLRVGAKHGLRLHAIGIIMIGLGMFEFEFMEPLSGTDFATIFFLWIGGGAMSLYGFLLWYIAPKTPRPPQGMVEG